jgi:hypothetical protein
MNCRLGRTIHRRRYYLRMSILCLGLLLCTANSSPSVAMGKLPSEAISDQLAEYRRVLLAYFKAFNLLPILLPAGQKPGDVFDMSQRGVLSARAEECFPGLVQPAPVPSALAYTFQLDSSKAGLALGLPQLGSVDLSGDFEQTITVSYTDVKVVTVSERALSNSVSESCKEVAAVVRRVELPLQPPAQPTLLAIIGTLVTAKREIFIGAKENFDAKASVDKVSTLLAVGISSSLKIIGLDPSMSVALGFGAKKGVLVQSDQELPVAFMPSFIPEIIFTTFQGNGAAPPQPRALQWRSFDPAAAESTELLGTLIDAAIKK